MVRKFCAVVIALVAGATVAFGQPNGKLQIHFMDVGQGDGAILISPSGETVLFDNGVSGLCDRPLNYLRQLKLSRIDYQVVSHYHADHIGCTTAVFSELPLQHASFDRGGEYRSNVFDRYVDTVGSKRQSPTPGDTLTLDSASSNPVQIVFVALNGNGVKTRNENDLSVVALVRFGEFEVAIGGDLSGYNHNSYHDIESSVAKSVGQVEVYKVHHHCSRYSTNDAWLDTTLPKVGVISAGVGNGYGHPTEECLERLHAVGTKTYWTSVGQGAVPEEGMDIVAQGTIVLEVTPNATSFTIGPASGDRDEYPLWGAPPVAQPTLPAYSWSIRSDIYHLTSCRVVRTISHGNLRTGAEPPSGKTLHKNCPLH